MGFPRVKLLTRRFSGCPVRADSYALRIWSGVVLASLAILAQSLSAIPFVSVLVSIVISSSCWVSRDFRSGLGLDQYPWRPVGWLSGTTRILRYELTRNLKGDQAPCRFGIRPVLPEAK